MTVDAGVLRSCSATAYPSGDLAPDLARLHHRIRVEVARQLGAVVCAGWEVSAACSWSLVQPEGLLLCPDVVVHRILDPGGRLPVPPSLCVVVGAGPPDRRSANAYARAGVDHHWYLDSRSGVVEVSVRVDDEYRRAETVTTSDVGEWIDFGVGIVRLTAVVQPACPRAAPSGR
jgi:hypothetical protein